MTDTEMVVAAAEKILGWNVVPFDDSKQYRMAKYPAYFWRKGFSAVMVRPSPDAFAWDWSPLASDADAFILVDALASQGWLVSVRQMPSGVPFLLGDDGGSEYSGSERPVRVLKRGACLLEWHGEGFRHSHFAFDDNRRRAIVLAALRAVGASE